MNLKHTNNFVQKLTRSFINPLNVITLTLDPRYITVVHVLKQSGVVQILLNDIDARKDQLEDLYKNQNVMI